MPVRLADRLVVVAKEQERKTRIKGLDAVKSNIMAAKIVSRTMRSSLGPKGMDKMLQSPDGDVTISTTRMRSYAADVPGAKS